MRIGINRYDDRTHEEARIQNFRGRLDSKARQTLGIEDLATPITTIQPEKIEKIDLKQESLFNEFLELLRKKGVRVSVPEWLNFLQLIQLKMTSSDLKKMLLDSDFLSKLKIYSLVTLIKNKEDYPAFQEAFDEFFGVVSRVYKNELESKQSKDTEPELYKLDIKPSIKDKLGIQEVTENSSESDSDSDSEQVHGGQKDQHNDILSRMDSSKLGGGNQKESQVEERSDIGEQSDQEQGSTHQEAQMFGYLIGGGKGNYIHSIRLPNWDTGQVLTPKKDLEDKILEDFRTLDRRSRYTRRPENSDFLQIIRRLRKIIEDVSKVKSKNVDLKATVKNFARRKSKLEFTREEEKQPEIVLFIDVGGPVDEWSPLVKDMAEAMSKGLTKLEVYLFHNNLYGYVWSPESKDFLDDSFPKPNSLIDIKSICKGKKKVIIYGDAQMSQDEFFEDMWVPQYNEERIKKYSMDGNSCLEYIRKHSESVVWINPIFRSNWLENDASGTIRSVGEIIRMFDLSLGGVEDAILYLNKS